jgi:serine/threonine protein kinase
MDYCSGGNLYEYISSHGPLDEPTAASIFKQVASAVALCHSFGIAHRDLKLDNILIDQFPHVKVSDLGLCGYLSEDALMQTFCGSPCYSAPECLCRVEYDGRLADVWSLGVILYLLLVGRPPWNISNTSLMLRQIVKADFAIPKSVSVQSRSLIASMLRVQPSERATIDQILVHPWFSVCVDGPVKPVDDGIEPVHLKLLAKKTEEAGENSVMGIVSPFANEIDEVSEMPKPLVRREQMARATGAAPLPVLRNTFGEGIGRRTNVAKLLLPKLCLGQFPRASSKTFA